jgi:hypothetical protein
MTDVSDGTTGEVRWVDEAVEDGVVGVHFNGIARPEYYPGEPFAMTRDELTIVEPVPTDG